MCLTGRDSMVYDEPRLGPLPDDHGVLFVNPEYLPPPSSYWWFASYDWSTPPFPVVHEGLFEDRRCEGDDVRD